MEISLAMVDTLLRNISYLLTMDDANHELTDVDLSITGNQIETIGKGLKAEPGTEIVDASNLIVTPG
jgi:N-acyl-D-aspartate/D-glutamate deacylase|tara:strand:+ start:8852 stop:9052 length:201 start_codon:yes stop_codon:yes gene_type:complete